jgi:hypothetical protein
MGALDAMLKSDLWALPHGPWHTETFAADTAAPTCVVFAGERPVCVVTASRQAEGIARIIARLPDLLDEAQEHADTEEASAAKVETVSDERDDLRDEVNGLREDLREAEANVRAARAEATALHAQLADLRAKL